MPPHQWQCYSALHSIHEMGKKKNQCCKTLGPSLDTGWPSPQTEVTFIFSTTAGACQQIIKRKHHMKSFRRQPENGLLLPGINPCTSKQWMIHRSFKLHAVYRPLYSTCNGMCNITLHHQEMILIKGLLQDFRREFCLCCLFVIVNTSLCFWLSFQLVNISEVLLYSHTCVKFFFFPGFEAAGGGWSPAG